MNELAILDAIRLIHTPWLDTLVAAYTSTSDVGQIWILLGIVLAIIPKTRKLGAAVLIAVLLGAIVTSGILKPLIMRPRPCDVNPLVPMIIDRPHGSSFPSGHATAAFAAFGALLFSKGPKPLVIVVGIGAGLMAPSGVHLSPVYNGRVEPVTLSDAYGEVRFYLLPFIKPANVRRFYPDAVIESYTDALRCAVEHMDIAPSTRNVLVTHQFVTGGVRSESEDITVGGTDNVDAAVFDGFDYVALGHLHGAQSIGRETLRYSGTPLKYSFSEKDQEKSITVVELGEKGSVSISTLPLRPQRDMREVRGTYDELTLRGNYAGTNTDDYIHAVLTDENDIPNAFSRLQSIYPQLMKLDYDNRRTRASVVIAAEERRRTMTDTELFAEFFEIQNGQKMTDKQSEYVKDVFATVREEML